MRHILFHYADGTKIYFKDNVKHNKYGPAVICPDGYQEYACFGAYHCDSGPAVIDENLNCQFRLHGQIVTPLQWKEYTETDDETYTYLKLKYSFNDNDTKYLVARFYHTPIDKYFNCYGVLDNLYTYSEYYDNQSSIFQTQYVVTNSPSSTSIGQQPIYSYLGSGGGIGGVGVAGMGGVHVGFSSSGLNFHSKLIHIDFY